MSTEGDPELDLAVAKAMGKNMVQPVNVETGNIWTCEGLPERYWVVDLGAGARSDWPLSACHWRPTLGGAAGAEVLEWALKRMFIGAQINDDGTAYLDARGRDNGRFGPSERKAPSFWLALCRAVVAWEEQDDD